MKLVCLALTVFGLGLALSAGGCSDMCSATGSAGTGGTGGAANCSTGAASGGSAGAAPTCGELTAVQTCFNTFCKADGAGSPFCNCWLKGYDLSPPTTDSDGNEAGCACITFDTAAFCTANAGVDPSTFDCSSASGQVATMCVSVQ